MDGASRLAPPLGAARHASRLSDRSGTCRRRLPADAREIGFARAVSGPFELARQWPMAAKDDHPAPEPTAPEQRERGSPRPWHHSGQEVVPGLHHVVAPAQNSVLLRTSTTLKRATIRRRT